MAMTGVLRPGHVQVRVVELDPAVHFYRDVLGLVETGRDSVGRVYFKAWDERDHNSVVLRQADRPGIDHFAFKVRDSVTLDKFDGDLRAWARAHLSRPQPVRHSARGADDRRAGARRLRGGARRDRAVRAAARGAPVRGVRRR